MSKDKKHGPPTPEVEDLINRLDDRYLTQKAAVYYFGILSGFLLPVLAWVVISIFSLKEQVALNHQAIARNEVTMTEFIQYHKEQIEILKSITHSTDLTVTAIKSEMDERERERNRGGGSRTIKDLLRGRR